MRSQVVDRIQVDVQRQTSVRTQVIDVCRALTSAAVMLSAVVHLDLYAVQGFREIRTIGPLFLLNVVAGLTLGVLVLLWRHWIPPLLAAGYGLATVTAFWISVVHGLFGLHEIAGGSAQVLAEISEYAAIVFGLVAAAGLWWWREE
jgi:hypothetical protein